MSFEYFESLIIDFTYGIIKSKTTERNYLIIIIVCVLAMFSKKVA